VLQAWQQRQHGSTVQERPTAALHLRNTNSLAILLPLLLAWLLVWLLQEPDLHCIVHGHDQQLDIMCLCWLHCLHIEFLLLCGAAAGSAVKM
jgi:hypothetical protein